MSAQTVPVQNNIFEIIKIIMNLVNGLGFQSLENSY